MWLNLVGWTLELILVDLNWFLGISLVAQIFMNLSTALFTRVVFALKRVQIQMDPKYTTYHQIIYRLKYIFIVERVYLGVFILNQILTVTMIGLLININEDETTSGSYHKAIVGVFWVQIIIGIIFIILNIVMVFRFNSLALYYVRTLESTNTKSR